MSSAGQHFLSGALSGFTSTICLQPFDLLKTRVQQGDGVQGARKTMPIVRTAHQIVVSNGMAGLWRGTTVSLVRNVPGVSIYMTSLTQVRTILAKYPYFSRTPRRSSDTNVSVLPTLTSQGNLLAGATTRIGVGFFLNPFSVLKARFESNIYAYKTIGGAFISIVRLGPNELLRGFLASCLRDAPYAGLFVVFYEGMKRECASVFPATSNAHASLIHGFAAASAGSIATMATHPFDVIKVRSEHRYDGMMRTVSTIWKQRGVLGFLDGASLRMSRKVLSSAIGWAAYEGMLMFMRSS